VFLVCGAGYFGTVDGQGALTCNGTCAGEFLESFCMVAWDFILVSLCVGGYFCPAGSTNGTAGRCLAGTYCPPQTGSLAQAIACPVGSYCPEVSAGPVACAAGRYGSTASLRVANCTGSYVFHLARDLACSTSAG
jgi:hypothetical protein